jgi:DNA polymerase-3 subunit delta'
MAFRDFPAQPQGIQLLQRSLEAGRLAHAYLFTGHQLEELETLARTLAKTLNCLRPVRSGSAAIDCCDQCLACQKIDHGNHADVHWVRPESKSRIVTIDQMRDLMKEIQLKPTEAAYKVAIVVAADRLRTEAANAFLKTLEEPPTNSILILLTTEPQRLLETILSRCLRLNFATDGRRPLDPAQREWLNAFCAMAAADQKSLLGRYRLMDVLLRKLNAMKAAIDEALTARSPLQQYKDVEKDLVEKWEDELAAAIEAEYRRQRADLLGVLHSWLRDVWLHTLPGDFSSPRSTPARSSTGDALSSSPSDGGRGEPRLSCAEALANFPELDGTKRVATRLSPQEATDNLQVLEQLQRWLGTNVQEALAIEVGLLKLRL